MPKKLLSFSSLQRNLSSLRIHNQCDRDIHTAQEKHTLHLHIGVLQNSLRNKPGAFECTFKKLITSEKEGNERDGKLRSDRGFYSFSDRARYQCYHRHEFCDRIVVWTCHNCVAVLLPRVSPSRLPDAHRFVVFALFK